MKTLIATLMTLVSINAFAATINSGTYDHRSDTIVLDVTYQGGCKDHNFQVKLNMCNRSTPATCTAELVDNTEDDVCRGFVQKTVRIPAETVLGELNVDQLLIRGDSDSSALIDLY